MARSKLARRFEPRGGVSQSMLDAESKYVGYELDDYLLYSLEDLRTNLRTLRQKIATVEEELQAKLISLPDRERLALRSMLARDIYHIAMLYCTFIASSSVIEATGPNSPADEEMNEQSGDPVSALSFSEWLFEP
jgi:hypothetical protein